MPVVAVKAELTEKPRQASRIEALDWTKGALVLCMVVYHAIVYSAFLPMAFKFLAFLPPSFIFIAGFLVGQVYATRYDLQTWKPYLRLLVRGVKLLVLFLAMNVLACIYFEQDFLDGISAFCDHAGKVLVSGNGRNGVFEVLLPIAYFLMLAPALLWLRSRAKGAIALCAGTVFLLCLGLETRGISLKNLSLLSAGLLGMAFGLIPIAFIDRFARRWFVILPLYVAYRLCSHFLGETYPVQMFGALSSVMLLYGCALHLDCASVASRQIVLLGNYSLLGYLAQIPLLRVIVRLRGGRPDHWLGVFEVMIAATVLLFFAVRIVHELRQRSRLIDGSYKAVFA